MNGGEGGDTTTNERAFAVLAQAWRAAVEETGVVPNRVRRTVRDAHLPTAEWYEVYDTLVYRTPDPRIAGGQAVSVFDPYLTPVPDVLAMRYWLAKEARG